MSSSIIGVLIYFTALVTVVFSDALPENGIRSNESILPMEDDNRLDNQTRLALEFIRINDEKFQLGSEDEAVIILGTDSSGKTSLSLLLTDGEMESIHNGYESYNLVDKNNRICNEDPVCDLTLPVIDTFNGTTYYDWSAFDRYESNISEKILVSQLLKKFAKSNKSAKFVFVMPEYYFEMTQNYFTRFTTMVSNLFVNVSKYGNAIGFVVTKSRPFVTDETIIKKAVGHLKSVRSELQGHLERNDQQGHDLNGMIRFIDILLEKSGGKHKIGVFAAINEKGPIKELEIPQNNKIAIRSMIANQLQFVKTDANDFGYAVEDKTKRTKIYKKLMLQL